MRNEDVESLLLPNHNYYQPVDVAADNYKQHYIPPSLTALNMYVHPFFNCPQGCVIIFFNNFLALLIKVDVGDESDRAVFGGILVAINVFLAIAVVTSSWIAVQKSVDDTQEDESLHHDHHQVGDEAARNSAQSTRGGSAPISSAPPSVSPVVSLPDPGVVWRG